ncbi:MAG TPA: hypothetical protein VEC06_15820 [Paucimonas sp.]|nr:hypothetical protein [Paucimonas sp.]
MPEPRDISIFVVTTCISQSDRQAVMDAAANAFLSTPIDRPQPLPPIGGFHCSRWGNELPYVMDFVQNHMESETP